MNGSLIAHAAASSESSYFRDPLLRVQSADYGKLMMQCAGRYRFPAASVEGLLFGSTKRRLLDDRLKIKYNPPS